MIKDRRANFRSGTSTVLALPAAMEIGETSTLAANRIMLVDPRGRIPESDLLQFLEEEVEPRLWFWLERRERKAARPRYEQTLKARPRWLLPRVPAKSPSYEEEHSFIQTLRRALEGKTDPGGWFQPLVLPAALESDFLLQERDLLAAGWLERRRDRWGREERVFRLREVVP